MSDQIEDRNAIMAEKKEVMISMDPMIASKFSASTHVSRKYDAIFSDLYVILFYSFERSISQYAQDE